MPFGYLKFSRAIGRDLCPPAHVYMRAAAGGGGRPAPVPGSGSGSGLGLGSGSSSLPGLVLFESGLAGMSCSATRTRPAPLRPANRPAPLSGSEPIRQRLRTSLDYQRLRTNWTAKGCNSSDRTVASFRWVRTCWSLLERYIKRSHLSIETHQVNNSLSLFLSEFCSRSKPAF